jgi:hypothetical protein
MRRASVLGLLFIGCSARATPAQSKHTAAEPHVALARVDVGHGSAAFVLEGGNIFGTRVLYGTDFGNTRDARIQEQELSLLISAGFDGPSIVKAGTSTPAEFLGLSELGSLAVGKRASFLVLAQDPSADPHTLSQPVAVYTDGKLISAGM